MQIGDYRAYAKIPRKEFSKNDQYLQKNPTGAAIVMYGYFPGSTDLWWIDCRSDDFNFPFLCSFRVLIHVFLNCKSFLLLL